MAGLPGTSREAKPPRRAPDFRPKRALLAILDRDFALDDFRSPSSRFPCEPCFGGRGALCAGSARALPRILEFAGVGSTLVWGL
jgi:hypothetical protein